MISLGRWFVIILITLSVISVGVIAVLNTTDETIGLSIVSDIISPSVSTATVEDISHGSKHVVEKLNDCKDEKYVEAVAQFGNCTTDVNECDSTNTTCHTVTREYSCYTGSVNVEKTRIKCENIGYRVGKYKLDSSEYACSVDVTDKDVTILTCDSKYDGNGDGICRSGESCMKFVIDGNTIDSYRKNSRDEFVKDDPTFFLSEISSEVEE